MTSKLELDPRLDPRIKAYFAGIDLGAAKPNVASREELLAQEHFTGGRWPSTPIRSPCSTPWTARTSRRRAGLTVRTETFTSAPDGNTVKIQFIRPEGDETLPCIYYIHGGRMAFSSCYEGNYKTWGRMIAARGVAVAMVDFRNAVHPASAPEIAPFPGGPQRLRLGPQMGARQRRPPSASIRRASSSPAKAAAATSPSLSG